MPFFRSLFSLFSFDVRLSHYAIQKQSKRQSNDMVDRVGVCGG
jgi:hypothetical protein